MNNNLKGKLGEKYIQEYFIKKGYKVIEKEKGEIGFDFWVVKENIKLKIEVKTSENTQSGIPDMHDTEFCYKNGKLLLVSDLLCILRIDKNGKPIALDILTKKEVDKYSLSHKIVTRIRTTKLDIALKNNLVGKKILV